MHSLNSNSTKPRLYCLDWIRVLAFGLLLFYHAALIFVDSNFQIKNNEFFNGLKLPMIFTKQWRMPLLFFISGAGSWFALKNISGGAFLKERFIRLFVPLTFGFLIIVPIQNYVALVHRTTADSSYFHFLVDHFTRHFRWNHLWFIGYLLVYTLIALPVFLYVRGEAGKKLANKLTGFFSANRFSLLLLVIPLFIVEYTLRDAWPDKRKLYNDWYNFSFYFIALIYGYFIASNLSIWERIEVDRTFYFLLGVVCFIFVYRELQKGGGDILEESYAFGTVGKLIKCIGTVSWMLCFLGYAKRYLNFSGPRLQYMNRAAYPFYILHHPFLFFMGYFVVQLESGIFTKYMLIVSGTLVLIGVFYELIIRRSKWAALVFGVKERDIIQKKPEHKAMPVNAEH